MKIVHEVAGYETSRDYEKLADLMQSQSVICMVDCYNGDFRDICQTIFSPADIGIKETWQISARGISYVYQWDRAGFIRQCERSNVEFIIPSKQP